VRLAISGKMRSGKDAVAAALVKRSNQKWVQINIADSIRRESQNIYNLAKRSRAKAEEALYSVAGPDADPETVAELLLLAETEHDITVRNSKNRRMLQQLAALGRDKDPYMWVLKVVEEADRAEKLDPTISIVTTDVREPVEVEILYTNGFQLVRLLVDPTVQHERILSDGVDPENVEQLVNHPNELALDSMQEDLASKFSLFVQNNGKLFEAVETISQRLNIKTQGTLLCVTGPSGSGKNTLADYIIATRPNWKYSVSVTTRKPRKGERNGIDYIFVDEETFNQMLKEGSFVEHAQYASSWYGTLRQTVVEALENGENLIAIVELDGAEQIKETYPAAKLVFLKVEEQELRRRLDLRSSESEEEKTLRLKESINEAERGPRMADLVLEGGPVKENAEACVKLCVI